ncbi:pirin family protein [Haloterrigena alkaliphila]|uniref:Pirin family protein n=1 Tax=Haloterrigena alkaliphila TaxID=2816475 RepID=A0A8A2VDZ7_9EURY|nr:pirin family protein [Haloterrigena alkaliphila]QSW98602.1 pirin family protein [Haloterrigena alkaliphila]
MDSSEAQSTPDGPIAGEAVRHGTGVQSNRAFPTNGYPRNLDPFVLFERFYIDPDEGFPMHPHRGFEIVSYMIDGGMEHEDSLGVTNTAAANDAMRITAGEGIRHSEFPADGRACNGLQLWVNLPRAEKDVEPDYVDATAAELPTEERGGATVTTVVGEGSPIDLRTPMEYLDVSVSDAWTWSIPDGWSGFLYGVAGEGTVDGDAFTEGDVLPVTDARDVALRTDGSLRAVAVSGRPHGEPIRQRGPFVL